MWIWLGIVLTTLLLLVLTAWVHKNRIIVAALALVVLIDISVNSNMYLKDQITFSDTLIDKSLLTETNKIGYQRVIYQNEKIIGDEPLFYKTWGVFGYSVYENEYYKNFMKSLGFGGVRRAASPHGPILQTSLETLGITKILNEDGNITELPKVNNSLDLFDINGTYIVKENGYVKISTVQNENITVNTKIRNYSGWEIKINDQLVNNTSNKNGMFISFPLNAGRSIVEMTYIPNALIKGFLLSLLMASTGVFGYCCLRRSSLKNYITSNCKVFK
jgi:hypothetical protein